MWDGWRLWSKTCITFRATTWWRHSICQSLSGCIQDLADGRGREREKGAGFGWFTLQHTFFFFCHGEHTDKMKTIFKKTWNFLFGACSWVVLVLSVSWSSEWSRPLRVWWTVCSVRDASLRLPDHYFSPWIPWRKKRDMLFVAHVSWCEPQWPLTWWGKNQWWTD